MTFLKYHLGKISFVWKDSEQNWDHTNRWFWDAPDSSQSRMLNTKVIRSIISTIWIRNVKSKVIRLISGRSQKLPWLSKLWLSWFINIKILNSRDNFFGKDIGLWFPLIFQFKSSFYSHFANKHFLTNSR